MIIDTKNKTVSLGDETLGEVVEQLQAAFPGTWKEYKVVPQTVTIILTEKEYIHNPYPFIPSPVYPMNPYYDHDPLRITCEIRPGEYQGYDGFKTFYNDTCN